MVNTYDSAFVSVEVVNDVRRPSVPQKHVAAVTAADDVLTPRSIEVDTLHCNIHTCTSHRHLMLAVHCSLTKLAASLL